MIRSFANGAAEDIFNGVNSRDARSVPVSLWPVVMRKLDMLNAAEKIGDLAAIPGNRLERLRGDLAGKHSIRINGQFRVVFPVRRKRRL